MLLNSIPFLPPTCRLISGRHLLPSFCVSLCRPSSHQQQGRRRKNSLFGSCLGSFSTREHLDGATYVQEGEKASGKKVLVHFFKRASCFCPVFCLFSLRLLCSQVPPRQGRGKGKKLQWTFSFLRQRGLYTTQQSCTTVWGHKWIAAFVPFVTDGTHKSPISESRKGGEEEERAMGRGEEDACLKRYYYTTYTFLRPTRC